MWIKWCDIEGRNKCRFSVLLDAISSDLLLLLSLSFSCVVVGMVEETERGRVVSDGMRLLAMCGDEEGIQEEKEEEEEE